MSDEVRRPDFKTDIVIQVMDQIRRIREARAMGDEVLYQNEVMNFKDLLPPDRRHIVEALEEEYTHNEEKTHWSRYCGVKVGTLEKPIELANGEVSPSVTVELVTDHPKLFQIIYKQFIELGFIYATRPNDNRKIGYRSL